MKGTVALNQMKYHETLGCHHLLQDMSKAISPDNKEIFLLIAASLIAQLVKNPPAMQETSVQFLGQEDLLKKCRLLTPVFLDFPCGSAGKESACNAGDLGLILGLGRSPGEGKGYPLLFSSLENSMDCIVHGIAKIYTTE